MLVSIAGASGVQRYSVTSSSNSLCGLKARTQFCTPPRGRSELQRPNEGRIGQADVERQMRDTPWSEHRVSPGAPRRIWYPPGVPSRQTAPLPTASCSSTISHLLAFHGAAATAAAGTSNIESKTDIMLLVFYQSQTHFHLVHSVLQYCLTQRLPSENRPGREGGDGPNLGGPKLPRTFVPGYRAMSPPI